VLRGLPSLRLRTSHANTSLPSCQKREKKEKKEVFLSIDLIMAEKQREKEKRKK